MIVEITMGYTREELQVPITEETTKAWNILTKEIAEIKAKGWIVDIPFDI